MTTTLHSDDEPYLGLPELSEMLGVTYNSARTYHGRAEINRRRGKSKPGDLPPPDRRFGRSPVWRLSTIERWMPHRPGRGTGGGAPERLTA
jgi:predicted DNA-binding transcriptional regulator AlpA